MAAMALVLLLFCIECCNDIAIVNELLIEPSYTHTHMAFASECAS